MNSEKIEILLGLDQKEAPKLPNLMDLKVRNNRGQAVPLKAFVEVKEEFGPSSIQRLDGVRTITLFGEVDEAMISGKAANKTLAPHIKRLKTEYPTMRIATGGGEMDRINALQDTMRLYLLAILMIFMVISLSFRSLIYPFLVLVTIPFGLCGVVWSLELHNQPPSLMAMIGMVGLSGVVVNVSIILLSYVQSSLRMGASLREAILDASVRRLRPILITTVTTLAGLVPTIYGIGGMDLFIQPIALVLGWGLLVATLLTVFAFPAMLSFLTFLKPKTTEMALLTLSSQSRN